jgi:hypothetical protein
MAKKAKAKRVQVSKVPAKKAAAKRTISNYPISETLQWAADGERLLIKWGAIKSPGAKRIANAVASVLGVLQALTELQKA